jgi:putative glycosyltransferase (TIGR04372 family)
MISTRKLKEKILNRLESFVTIALLSSLNFKWGSMPRRATRDQVTTIRHSEILGRFSSIDIDDAYREWERSERIWNEGKYFESVEIKKGLLHKLYAAQEIKGVQQTPPFLSVGWGAAIGHIGSLGAYVLGQKLGMIPSGVRNLPITNDYSAQLIENFLQDNVHLVATRVGFSILEHPSQWHLSERLAVVRTTEDFISLYELHESVYRNPNVFNQNAKLSISREYESRAIDAIGKLGLPEDAWFVGVHIREKPNSLDPRVAKLETFYDSIDEIVGRGGWIIRFGADKMQPLPFNEQVIDLNTNSEEFRKLHLFILARSKFLLTTNSGPSVVAWALGTPVLQTNTLSIGRNILSSSKGSLFLPKKYIDRSGRPCSFSQVLQSSEAYAETDLREKHLRGFQLLDNSAGEILDATKDMLHFVEHRNHDSRFINEVDEIRKEHNAVGYGLIAPSFLNKHENWFLK